MPIKLIALDLDGTLLNAKKEISRANKEALQAARAQGVKVVITTGRPLPAVELFLKELDLMGGEEYSITFNGGLVQTNDGGILDEIGFGIEAVESIYQTTRLWDCPWMWSMEEMSMYYRRQWIPFTLPVMPCSTTFRPALMLCQDRWSSIRL